MSWKWISFGILCLVLLFQYKNISSFIAVELALKGFKELDVNSDDVIDKSEWPGICLLYTSPSPRDRQKSRMPSSA